MVGLRFLSMALYVGAYEALWRHWVAKGPMLPREITWYRKQLLDQVIVSPGMSFGDYLGPRSGPGLMFVAMTPALVYPVLFVVLPWTRRQAKLRWAHVIRAAVYSTICVAPMLLLELAMSIARLYEHASGRQIGGWGGGGPGERVIMSINAMYQSHALALFVFVWILWWWRSAMLRGWRLQRGLTLWSMLTLCAVLASLVVASFVSRDLLFLVIRLGGV